MFRCELDEKSPLTLISVRRDLLARGNEKESEAKIKQKRYICINIHIRAKKREREPEAWLREGSHCARGAVRGKARYRGAARTQYGALDLCKF